MTTYNTGNPVPSADTRDRYDNSQAFDEAVTGRELTFTDRLGVERKSWAGLEQQFADFLASQGWESAFVQYAADAVVLRPTQLVEREGELYRVALQSNLPLTLEGDWASDAPKLVAVGNKALRTELSDPDGSGMVGRPGGGSVADLFTPSGSGLVGYGDVSITRALDDRVKTSHSQVNRLLNSAKITDLYIISHPSSSDGRRKIGVGVCFSGTDSPVAEYQFDQDQNNWWRLFGAYTGFARQDSSADAGFEPVLSGAFTQSTSVTSTYTTTVGDKFTAYFQGATAQFVSYCDNRGGRWRFRVNGKQTAVLSVWRATAGQYTMTIAEGLDPDRVYKIEAEFLGADPSNAPSSGDARGWLIYRGTSNEYGTSGGVRAIMDREKTLVLDWAHTRTPRPVISAAGINEFAFRVSEIGASLPETWVPHHGGDQIAYSVETTLLVDGKAAAYGDFASRKSIESLVIEQRFIFRQGGDSTNLGYVSTRHRIDRSGKLTFDWRILGLVDFNVGTWYSAQLMTDSSVCPRLVLNNDQSIRLSQLAADSETGLAYNDVDSAAFVGISSGTAGIYHGAAIDVDFSSARGLTKGLAPATTPLLLTTRASDNVAKIYWRATNGYEFKAGESYQGGVTIAAVTGISMPNELDVGYARGSIL